MTNKQNCWEFTGCGRQPGGSKTEQLGVCVAATDSRANGIHGGVNAGRACWGLAGTLCGGEVQGSLATKLGNCLRCDFYHAVSKSQGADLKPLTELRVLFD